MSNPMWEFVLFLFIGMMPGTAFAESTPTPAPTIIRVPTDYTTISEAVGHAVAGDTIFVASGRYDEKIMVQVPIKIIGEKASSVILQRSTSGAGIYLRANGITLENITSITSIDTLAINLNIRHCIIRHKLQMTGGNATVDRCIFLIDENVTYGRPGNSDGNGGAAIRFISGGVASNNLILGVHQGDAGHFDGPQPPFVTPTPGNPDPHRNPIPGWADDGAGIIGDSATKVVNNTIVNISGGNTGFLEYTDLFYWSVLIPGNATGIGTSAYSSTYVANNIIWNIQGGIPEYPNYDGNWVEPGYSQGIFVGCGEGSANSIFENNIIWSADYPIVVHSNCDTAMPVFRNNYWVSPGFVDPVSGDYHLRPNSPAIDSGTPIAWLKADIEGNSRPTNYGWDIGAFEYQNLLSDFNKDGDVNAKDLGEFARQWNLQLPKVEKTGKEVIVPIPAPDDVDPPPSADRIKPEHKQ